MEVIDYERFSRKPIFFYVIVVLCMLLVVFYFLREKCISTQLSACFKSPFTQKRCDDYLCHLYCEILGRLSLINILM